MKKLLRWIGYGLLLGCVLVGGYCIFLASGLAERVFPAGGAGVHGGAGVVTEP